MNSVRRDSSACVPERSAGTSKRAVTRRYLNETLRGSASAWRYGDLGRRDSPAKQRRARGDQRRWVAMNDVALSGVGRVLAERREGDRVALTRVQMESTVAVMAGSDVEEQFMRR